MEAAFWSAIILRSLRNRDVNNMKQTDLIEFIIDELNYVPQDVSIPDILDHIQTRMKIEKMTPIFDGSYKMDSDVEPSAPCIDKEIRNDCLEITLYVILLTVTIICFVLAVL